ncbi:MAG: transposase, partial [Muribaculaceae bacterium]|nr:transposase [Muribaculaceae bacterium]
NKSALGKELTDYECEVTNALFGEECFDQLLEAAGSFLKCLRSNKPLRLERWLDKYEKSILPRIRTFVRGIRMDIKAVKNAMIYPVSNGITEGFVNKLKTIKRVMYGKAKLPLLKIKMVMPT